MGSDIKRVSTTSTNGEADGASSLSFQYDNSSTQSAVGPNAFSADGSEIAFVSNATDITGDGSGQVVLKNLATGQDTLVTGSGTVTGAADVSYTPDGKKLIIDGYSGGGQQIYETDPTTGNTVLVSSNATGVAGDSASSPLAVSTDGSRVAFFSTSSNLVPGQATNVPYFVKDLATGNIVQIGDGNTNTFNFNPSLSTAVYTDEPDDDVAGPPPEVYAQNLTTGVRTLVSGNGGVAGNKGGFGGIVLADGNHVAFNSESTDLVAGAPSGGIFVKDLTTNTISTALANNVTFSGNTASGTAYELTGASSDGTHLSYLSFAGSMVTNADGSQQSSGTTQIGVKDLTSGAVYAITPASSYTSTVGPSTTFDKGYESPYGPAGQGNSSTINGTISSGAVFSPDGTKIAYTTQTYTNFSYDSSATPPTTTGMIASQVFVYDTKTGTTTPVTSNAIYDAGARSGTTYFNLRFSPNSQAVAVDKDTVGQTSSQTIVANLATGGSATIPTDSADVFFSPDGKSVAFTSSQALVPNDTNMMTDVYIASNFTPEPVCFASGTRIRMARGDIAVEGLAVGDLAITASGARRPIIWFGHRTIDCRACADRTAVLPVRIAAGAFGDNRPARDLVVSPGHAVCVDVMGEVLIPAYALVNGANVTQEDADSVTYWHVELESHDILLAENLPCESYLQMGNRGFFIEADVVSLDALPDAPARSHADFCRPFLDSGATVAAVRARLAARARAVGWRLDASPFAGLHLEVDGAIVEPIVEGLTARFAMPAAARDVWLMCRTTTAMAATGSPDRRQLGVFLAALAIDGGGASSDTIALDDPRLRVGFHQPERHSAGLRRWTTGRAALPPTLWDGRSGTVSLRLDLAGPALPRLVAGTLDRRLGVDVA